jgi:hypothetical protein
METKKTKKKEGLTKQEVIAKITEQINANKAAIKKAKKKDYDTYNSLSSRIDGYELSLDTLSGLAKGDY